MNGITGYTMVNKDVAVTKTGIKLAASVTFTADGADNLPEGDQLQQADGNGPFKLGCHVAAVPRFLSDAGRLGVDGPAVDGAEADAAF
jgi:hypothetical protein